MPCQLPPSLSRLASSRQLRASLFRLSMSYRFRPAHSRLPDSYLYWSILAEPIPTVQLRTYRPFSFPTVHALTDRAIPRPTAHAFARPFASDHVASVPTSQRESSLPVPTHSYSDESIHAIFGPFLFRLSTSVPSGPLLFRQPVPAWNSTHLSRLLKPIPPTPFRHYVSARP